MAYFIAEVSSNHQQDLNRSLEFVDIAADIGCDAVKFQLFRIDKLFSPEILNKSVEHQRRKNWELPIEFLPYLSERCKARGIDFGCTPFYLDAISELCPLVDFFKIASYELLWTELLLRCAATQKNLIISTGMATLDEIIDAVSVLRNHGCVPTILHCNSSYPTPSAEANLAAINTIRTKTNCKTGWSDHTVKEGVIYRAIHKWDASVVEFHLDVEGRGSEYKTGHCWLPLQIEKVIKSVKCGMSADGSGEKKPTESEMSDRLWRADPTDGLRPIKSQRQLF